MESWRKELYHHGIKGQKWGVRRGPPYPIGSKPGSHRKSSEKSHKTLDKPAGKAYNAAQGGGKKARKGR